MQTPLGHRVRIAHVSEKPFLITHNGDRNDFAIIQNVWQRHYGTDEDVAYLELEKMGAHTIEVAWLKDITYDLFNIGERVVTDRMEPSHNPLHNYDWRSEKAGTVISIFGQEFCRKYVVVLDNGAVIVSDGNDLELEK